MDFLKGEKNYSFIRKIDSLFKNCFIGIFNSEILSGNLWLYRRVLEFHQNLQCHQKNR